eukprot:3847368-Alexandrium_andersonii.AAC.1
MNLSLTELPVASGGHCMGEASMHCCRRRGILCLVLGTGVGWPDVAARSGSVPLRAWHVATSPWAARRSGRR